MILQLFASVLVNFYFVLETRDDQFCVLLEVFELLHEIGSLGLFGEVPQVVINAHVFEAGQELAVLFLAGALKQHPVDKRDCLNSEVDIVRLETP